MGARDGIFIFSYYLLTSQVTSSTNDTLKSPSPTVKKPIIQSQIYYKGGVRFSQPTAQKSQAFNAFLRTFLVRSHLPTNFKQKNREDELTVKAEMDIKDHMKDIYYEYNL